MTTEKEWENRKQIAVQFEDKFRERGWLVLESLLDEDQDNSCISFLVTGADMKRIYLFLEDDWQKVADLLNLTETPYSYLTGQGLTKLDLNTPEKWSTIKFS